MDSLALQLLSSDFKARVSSWRKQFCGLKAQEFIDASVLRRYLTVLPMSASIMTKTFRNEGVLFASTRFYRTVCQSHTHHTRLLSAPQLPRNRKAATEEYLNRLTLFIQDVFDQLSGMLSTSVAVVESAMSSGEDPQPQAADYQTIILTCELIQSLSETMHAMSHHPSYLHLKKNPKATVQTTLSGLPSMNADPPHMRNAKTTRGERIRSTLAVHIRSTCPSVRQLDDHPVLMSAPEDHPLRAEEKLYDADAKAKFPVVLRAINFVPTLATLLRCQTLSDKRISGAILAATLSLPPRCTPGTLPTTLIKSLIDRVGKLNSPLPRIAQTTAHLLVGMLVATKAGYPPEDQDWLKLIMERLDLDRPTQRHTAESAGFIPHDAGEDRELGPLTLVVSALVDSVGKGMSALCHDPSKQPLYGSLITILCLVDIFGVARPFESLLSQLYIIKCRQLFDTVRAVPATYVYATTSFSDQSTLLESGMANTGRSGETNELSQDHHLGLWATVRACYMVLVSVAWSRYAPNPTSDLVELVHTLSVVCRDSFHPALVDVLSKAVGDLVFLLMGHVSLDRESRNDAQRRLDPKPDRVPGHRGRTDSMSSVGSSQGPPQGRGPPRTRTQPRGPSLLTRGDGGGPPRVGSPATLTRTLSDAHLNAFRTPTSRQLAGSTLGTESELSRGRSGSYASLPDPLGRSMKRDRPVPMLRQIRDAIYKAVLSQIGGNTYSGKRGGGIPLILTQVCLAEHRAVVAGFGHGRMCNWSHAALTEQAEDTARVYSLSFSLWNWLISEICPPALFTDLSPTPYPSRWDEDAPMTTGAGAGTAATVTLLNILETTLQNAELRQVLLPFHDRILLFIMDCLNTDGFIVTNAACSTLRWGSPALLCPGMDLQALERRWPVVFRTILTTLRTCPPSVAPVATLITVGALGHSPSVPGDRPIPLDLAINLLKHPRVQVRRLAAAALPALITSGQWSVLIESMASAGKVTTSARVGLNTAHGLVLACTEAVKDGKTVDLTFDKAVDVASTMLQAAFRPIGDDKLCCVLFIESVLTLLTLIMSGKRPISPPACADVARTLVETLRRLVYGVSPSVQPPSSEVVWRVLLCVLEHVLRHHPKDTTVVEAVCTTGGVHGPSTRDTLGLALIAPGHPNVKSWRPTITPTLEEDTERVGLAFLTGEAPYSAFIAAGLAVQPSVARRLAELGYVDALDIEKLPDCPTPRQVDLALRHAVSGDVSHTTALQVFTLAGRLVDFGLYGSQQPVDRVELLSLIYRRLKELPLTATELMGAVRDTALSSALEMASPTPAVVAALAVMYDLETPMSPEHIKRLVA